METYRNLSGESNVRRYQIGNNFIDVEFSESRSGGATTYKYTYASAGSSNVEHMKQLAQAGSGLNSFINKEVKDLYASKW